jgi:enoyl-CoA hydratase
MVDDRSDREIAATRRRRRRELGLAAMEHVTLSDHDSTVVLTVDRPPANAMDLALLRELVEAVEQVAGDPPRALVLAGRPGCFSAGADLKAVPGYGPDEQRQMVLGINAMALGVYGLTCPVVGAITGHAIAGGLVLALCTDLRVASSAGRYGLTEVKVGVPYPQAAIGVVAAELAPHAARVLALGNELVDAAECLRLGVFDEVLEPEHVLDRALQLAAGLATLPPQVYAVTKRELREATTERLREAAAQDPLLERWVG